MLSTTHRLTQSIHIPLFTATLLRALCVSLSGQKLHHLWVTTKHSNIHCRGCGAMCSHMPTCHALCPDVLCRRVLPHPLQGPTQLAAVFSPILSRAPHSLLQEAAGSLCSQLWTSLLRCRHTPYFPKSIHQYRFQDVIGYLQLQTELKPVVDS